MIEFFYWEGCPSHKRVLADLVKAMDVHGLERDDLRITEVLTERDAEREEFIGSPTIRIDGKDLQDPGAEPYGLTCRVYIHRDGKPSPLPDPDDLNDEIAAYAAKGD